MANLRRQNGREKPWQRDVLRRRQRDLGLRRQHAPRVLRRRVPPLQHLRQELRPRQAHLPHRLRRQRRRLQLDRGADETSPAGGWTACRCTTTRCRPATGRRKGSATGFGEDQWFSTLQQDAAHGRADHEARRDHGQAAGSRDRRERGRPGRRRVGHLVRRRARHESRLPLPAEHAARRARRRRSTSTSSTSTPTASRWPTSPRRSTCCRR